MAADRRLVGVVTATCASVVLAVGAAPAGAQNRAPAAAAVGGGAGRIVYASDGPLVIRHADGSGKRSVPRTKFWADPQWSPNGRWIVAVHGQRATVLHPDGSKRHAISPKVPASAPPGATRYATSPTWSHDGTKIAYVLQLDHKWEIRIVRPNGTLLKSLTKATKFLPSDTAWSPNGKRIAFVGTTQPNNPSPQWDIFSIRVNNSGVDRLTSTRGADELSPAWRPDSRRIVYERDYFHYRGAGSVRRQLYVMTPSGGNQHAIYDAPDFDSYMAAPAYSPDGTWVAFGYRGSDTSVKYGVRVVHANGTGVSTVSTDFGTDPSWR